MMFLLFKGGWVLSCSKDSKNISTSDVLDPPSFDRRIDRFTVLAGDASINHAGLVLALPRPRFTNGADTTVLLFLLPPTGFTSL